MLKPTPLLKSYFHMMLYEIIFFSGKKNIAEVQNQQTEIVLLRKSC